MINKYAKGYAAERQMLHTLAGMGYMVMRAPHSGSTSLASPDIIAAKHGKLLAIECKSRKGAFSIPVEQLNELKEWEEKAGAKPYIGWKIARKGWTFLHLKDVYENRGNVGKKFAEEKGISINDI
ncbi:MAG: Holliday junction resolvase Hjc [Candidatus Aenigmarchaeota archaeon]|nr:Holliday junction resolvase Hjc [Candidatus Aenigmarchaeota archaeon]